MRTTVTLDPDVQLLLKNAMRDRDASFKKVLNDAIRSGLADKASSQAALPPLEQRTFRLGVPLVDLTKANALAAELEDQEYIARMHRSR
jgi:hypothetical protein